MDDDPGLRFLAGSDRRLRVVVDTNVLVAALLTPGRVADQALEDLVSDTVSILIDERIVAEYRAVLARPKFSSIAPAARDARLARLLSVAESVVSSPLVLALVDDDDRRFIEVALAGRADAIVTGNAKHFPTDLGIAIVSPGRWLELRGRARRSDG